MRILFTGNLFHNYEANIKEGLNDLGHEVDMLFHNIHGPFQVQDVKTIPEWFKYGFLPYKLNINYFTDRSIETYNRELQRRIRGNNYDVLLVIGAKTIFPETIQMFKGRKVFWFMDGLPRYQYVVPKIPLFDDLFVFEPTDIAVIKDELQREALFLTLAFAPKRYYKKSLPERYDFSFVGSFYPKREQYLHSVLALSENLAICGDFYRSRHKELKKKMKGVNVPSEVANELYNSSKININIHHPQSKEGMAIRTFEIIGAGGFQIVERQKGALLYFEEDKHMAFYESEDEFLEKCRYYLTHETKRRQVAEAGHQLALQKHTWKARLSETGIF
jgi:spore maturation protein CgeB